ncbi:helix-turn-helix domain-containing protein [Lactobacillus sp. ESL0791]|uniref:helix-turn-helix domain-containing protein n=1 Tax=Lactobacillus sp. ESL0791 TaxID=2983234 RepID=UPI0023F6E116|nr:helix-turn-helix domain-containing protein [Lactobacillus sp. ESL0791]MDF7639413.1 helix-turn-helix domain-containing protein [Lactobacillus sp. ESL0791]
MDTLNERIRNLRLKKNWSQEELAEKMDVSRQSVSKWENGDAQPDLDKVVQLGKLFNVSLDTLLAGKDNEQEDTKSVNNEQASFYLDEQLRELRKIYGIAETAIYIVGSLIYPPLWATLWVIYIVGGLAYEINKFYLINKAQKGSSRKS